MLKLEDARPAGPGRWGGLSRLRQRVPLGVALAFPVYVSDGPRDPPQPATGDPRSPTAPSGERRHGHPKRI